ncbi:MAG: phosphoribosylformylglycinamidine synthase subunit PurL [Oligoflexia bacterium]|nr:phosphoribosylformylglycinamidine synthase subunit PurL [Oligoflexia bacterium]
MTTLKRNKYQLSAGDHKRLKSLLGREPSVLEIVLALALWNEHCSYRSSKKHLKKFQFPTQKKISGLGEQAGVVDLGQGEKICFKMESHNHPSYITPYHGAATAVGGILRDIFAMNARPIALADYLCFADTSRESELSVKKEQAHRVSAVVQGIGDYGNCIGVPTVTGQTEFSPAYNGNILVNAMALGYLDSRSQVISSQAKGAGNYVVYVGSATGRDGILGADMASQSFESDQSYAKPTVQIGDPFFGKQLLSACLLAMEKNLVLACQDMGAAGLTCSSFEMADKAGLGLSLHLDKTPLRDSHLQPEEILLSESQERMLFICKPSCFKELESLFRSYELEIAILGETLAQKEIQLYWKGKEILKVDPKLFTSHSPVEDRPYVFPKPVKRISPKPVEDSAHKVKALLLSALSSPQGRSRQFIYSQYDQRVGTNTLKDSSYPIAVLRLPESGRQLAVAMGCRPYLLQLDVEQGAKDAVFLPALKLAVRGFSLLAATDCLNFGNPEKPEIMGEFVLSVEKIAEACLTLDTPIVSGNVSFYNESEGKNITPTPSIVMTGLKEKGCSTPPAGFCKAGERVYLLHSHQFCFEGAIDKKAQWAYGDLQGPLVKIFIDQIDQLSQKNLFSSARVVGKFGLAYTLARMVLENRVGFSLKNSFQWPLFQERLYEIAVSVKREEEDQFKKELEKLGLEFVFLGETQEKAVLSLKGESLSYEEMKGQYRTSWQDLSL